VASPGRGDDGAGSIGLSLGPFAVCVGNRTDTTQAMFELWRAMTIEQRAHLEEFNAMVREKTAYSLDRDSPEWKAYRQTLLQCFENNCHGPDHASEPWEPVSDRFYELADEILFHDAVSGEGLALQNHAFISAYHEQRVRRKRRGTFIASVCAFLGVQFPPVEEAQS
jgi:hypothetical protein